MSVVTQDFPISAFVLGIFGLGGWEILLLIAVPLVLFGVRRLPLLARGLGDGVREFRKAWWEVDQEAKDAGESLGGIYGKPAAEGLTTDNQTAEFYDPDVLGAKPRRQPLKPGTSWWRRLWCRVCAFFGRAR